jgi:hypothetical protein
MTDPAGERHDGARRAWQRLTQWSTEAPSDGRRALDALDDIQLLRHRLDATELEAVRAARRTGRSWAEIATSLGITRQSAWERWRELDGPAGDEPESGAGAWWSGAAERVAEPMIARAAARLTRSRGLVEVPDLVSLTFDEAHDRLQHVGLQAGGPDPDGLPLTADGWARGTVVRQYPDPGSRVPRHSTVRLWLERGGGGAAGVREPRRPNPTVRSAAAEVDDAVEGVG